MVQNYVLGAFFWGFFGGEQVAADLWVTLLLFVLSGPTYFFWRRLRLLPLVFVVPRSQMLPT